MTTDSYATEDEDVFVKIYTSNGNGTFSYTNTTEYSAKHFSIKANADTLISDSEAYTNKTYSSVKIQALHDAQAVTIANLASASATIYNNTTQPIPEDPASFVDMVWLNNQESTNDTIFELGSSSFIFKKNGIYNFFNSLNFYRINGNSTPLTITFELYDADTGITVLSAGMPIDMAGGTKQVIPFNVLLELTDITSTPKTIKVRMQSTNVAGSIEIFSFNSILSLASASSGANVDVMDDALGAIITGVLV